ncbi:MAG: hypothetical protein ACPGLV_14430 [Bacteroidia bacterium]
MEKLHSILDDNFIEYDKSINNLSIYGNNGKLNSLNLVRLIVEVENAVLEKTGISIVLTDNSALSATKSPFKSVETLAAFINHKLKNEPN